MEVCGTEKIVFGSDMDLLAPAFTRGMFEGAGLSQQQQNMVYYHNAAQIFGLPTQDD